MIVEHDKTGPETRKTGSSPVLSTILKSLESVLFPLTGAQTVTPIEGAELSAPSFLFSPRYAGN